MAAGRLKRRLQQRTGLRGAWSMQASCAVTAGRRSETCRGMQRVDWAIKAGMAGHVRQPGGS